VFVIDAPFILGGAPDLCVKIFVAKYKKPSPNAGWLFIVKPFKLLNDIP
jgi:hypothetical protein